MRSVRLVSNLLGLALPAGETLDGKSLAPVLHAPNDPKVADALKPFALSQYMRCPQDTANASNFWKDNNCLMTDRTLMPFMGYSLRTKEWRYTEWIRWSGKTLRPIWSELVGRELYSHVGDDGSDFDAFENVNDVGTAKPGTVAGLSALLHAVVANQTRMASFDRPAAAAAATAAAAAAASSSPAYTAELVHFDPKPVVSFVDGSAAFQQVFNPAWVQASAGTGGRAGLLIRTQNCTAKVRRSQHSVLHPCLILPGSIMGLF
eukprot:SAG22_NODE_104_length_20159_cov_5.877517_18_plen_262_part_00